MKSKHKKQKLQSLPVSAGAAEPLAAASAGAPATSLKDESFDVQEVHAAILREHDDPQEGNEPTPLWLITLIGVLLFWGGFYLQRYSGGYKPLVFDERFSGEAPGPAQAAGPVDMVALGKRTYANNCVPCHQDSGLGVPGQFPPLAGSEWVLADGHARLARILLDGLSGPIEVKGQTYNNSMPPWRDLLDDTKIAAVLTHVRNNWGNQAAPVTPEDVKAVREKTKDRSGRPWSAPELLAIPVKE